jgi:outer membrane lipoprotein-sorting protein
MRSAARRIERGDWGDSGRTGEQCVRERSMADAETANGSDARDDDPFPHRKRLRYHWLSKMVNRWMRIGLVLAALACAAAASSVHAMRQAPAQRVKPADPFDEIFARGLAKRRAMQSLQARFTETTTSTLLTQPIVAHGTVVAASPARVRMTYTDLEPKVLTMDGKTLTIVWPGRNEREQLDMTEMQKRIDRYFTQASASELRSLFDISVRADSSVPRADVVDMRPKRKQIAQGLERLELWIDRASDLLVRMRMSFPGGDQKTIALEDITLNVPVTDATFQPPR